MFLRVLYDKATHLGFGYCCSMAYGPALSLRLRVLCFRLTA